MTFRCGSIRVVTIIFSRKLVTYSALYGHWTPILPTCTETQLFIIVKLGFPLSRFTYTQAYPVTHSLYMGQLGIL